MPDAIAIANATGSTGVEDPEPGVWPNAGTAMRTSAIKTRT
jgi:hypothetical protein